MAKDRNGNVRRYLAKRSGVLGVYDTLRLTLRQRTPSHFARGCGPNLKIRSHMYTPATMSALPYVKVCSSEGFARDDVKIADTPGYVLTGSDCVPPREGEQIEFTNIAGAAYWARKYDHTYFVEVEPMSGSSKWDNDDRAVSPALRVLTKIRPIEELYGSRPEEVVMGVVADWYHTMEFIPNPSEKVCRTAVEKNAFALEHIPASMQTPEMCMAAVQKCGPMLEYVAKKTAEICAAAVRQSGWAIQFVPAGLLTPELCTAAVADDEETLGYVPAEMQTPEMCMTAVCRSGDTIYYVANPTPELCMAAVVQDGLALEYVDATMKTPEMCTMAVMQEGLALKYVDSAAQTLELCTLAVLQNPLALKYSKHQMSEIQTAVAT